jgi:hypothetical protein
MTPASSKNASSTPFAPPLLRQEKTLLPVTVAPGKEQTPVAQAPERHSSLLVQAVLLILPQRLSVPQVFDAQSAALAQVAALTAAQLLVTALHTPLAQTESARVAEQPPPSAGLAGIGLS